MSEHTFTLWLQSEVTSARCALLTLYEQRDKLQYIEGPRLEKEYMDKVGSYEETVIKEEIECELLQKKQQMIQTAINRREPIDEAAIDAVLETHRQQMLQEAAGPAAPQEYAELSGEQSDELQKLYRDIVKNFHPQMHPELTEAHRLLFQKAQEAYRRRDLAALKLIHEMLYSTKEDGLALKLSFELLTGSKTEEDAEEETDPGIDYATDYTLAAMIYSGFKPTNEEAAIQEEWTRYRQMTDCVMREMDDMRLRFPYTASDMLSDPAKIEAYKEELAHRLRTAAAERERRTKKICAMIESVTVYE
ncbi:MAG: hypothetical protein ACI4F3_03105 [Enterocloster sp.]